MDASDFFSTDRLVEFGMGMAAATQMTKSMNEAMASMDVPGAGKTMPGIESSKQVYYAALSGEATGPFSLTEMARLVTEKKVVRETYVWKPGMAEWKLAGDMSELLELIAITPPPVPNQPIAIDPMRQ